MENDNDISQWENSSSITICVKFFSGGIQANF